MPGIVRLGDICTGHCNTINTHDKDGNEITKMCCFPPRSAIEGSPDVYVNNRPVHCITHKWDIHCGPTMHDDEGNIIVSCGCHAGTLSKSINENVICNWLFIGCEGDLISCGSKVANGSTDTIIG